MSFNDIQMSVNVIPSIISVSGNIKPNANHDALTLDLIINQNRKKNEQDNCQGPRTTYSNYYNNNNNYNYNNNNNNHDNNNNNSRK